MVTGQLTPVFKQVTIILDPVNPIITQYSRSPKKCKAIYLSPMRLIWNKAKQMLMKVNQ